MPDPVIKLCLAVLIGGLIGFERELRSKSAGFRTLILISLGATLFTMFSEIIGVNGSTDRIAANVVVGIGFLGAGVIFRGDNRVNGITTAASIWVTAALGVGIGSGYYMIAMVGCLLVLIVLFLFSFIDRYIDRINQIRDYKITFPYELDNEHMYEDVLKKYHLEIKTRTLSKSGNIIKGYWRVQGKESKHHAFIDHILKDNSATEFDF